MRLQNRPGWRAPRRTLDQRSPEEIAAALSRALSWRQQWRDEMAAGRAGSETKAPEPARQPDRPASQQDAGRLAKFAEAIARAEFGRAYWDKRRDVATQGRDKRLAGRPGKK
jgi:hypothetical protein